MRSRDRRVRFRGIRCRLALAVASGQKTSFAERSANRFGLDAVRGIPLRASPVHRHPHRHRYRYIDLPRRNVEQRRLSAVEGNRHPRDRWIASIRRRHAHRRPQVRARCVQLRQVTRIASRRLHRERILRAEQRAGNVGVARGIHRQARIIRGSREAACVVQPGRINQLGAPSSLCTRTTSGCERPTTNLSIHREPPTWFFRR